MINSFQQITAIRNFLQQKQEELGIAFKYRLVKHLNHSTSIYIWDETGQFKLNLPEILVEIPIGSQIKIPINDENIFPPVDVRNIIKEDYEEDKEYYDSFFEGDSSFEGITRRLDNAFGKYPSANKEASLPPIVSFYSYKGGVGRTTALAALASYHSRRLGTKTLILDCDFEAPGLINFFGMNEDDLAAKGGIVEYLTDVSYLKDKSKIDITDYIHTISASASKDPLGYAGEKGEIYVMNAGNVSVSKINSAETTTSDLRSHQDHYLHGLARLDFSNADHFISQFQDMLEHVNEAYHPDVILIDSRTGFNDIFNNIVLRLSDIVVGFFGTSKQNTPGLYNFLDTIAEEDESVAKKAPEIVLVNSIVPSARQGFTNFKELLEQYKQSIENELNPEVFSIAYHPVMAEIGTPTDPGDILLEFTDPSRYSFPDYQNGKAERLLEHLSSRIEKKNPLLNSANSSIDTLHIFHEREPEASYSSNKIAILAPLNNFFSDQNQSGQLYAENLDHKRKEFLNRYYYFRNYLRDLFLREMFIVRGYKGTGKTLLYHALEDIEFVKKLMQINEINEDYRFINIIDKDNHLPLTRLGFDPENTGDKTKTYYRRFWVVYIWNVLMHNLSNIYQSRLTTFDIRQDESTRRYFEIYIESKNILSIEDDLRKLDDILRSKGIKVVISFDYLDKIVEVSEWSKDINPISQLIVFGQFNPYKSLLPKIFVRTDLFHKTHGINNVNALENKVISFDWSTEELFAYFFKVVYRTSGEAFINWLQIHNPNKREFVLSINDILLKNNAQIPLEHKGILEFLVNNFFGEYVNVNIPNFGKSYEWFYNNLKNANDVISVRPFIALLAYCLGNAVETTTNSNDPIILPGKYFNTSEARIAAATAYLKDIWNDYPDTLRLVLETLHQPHRSLDRFRYHSLTALDLTMLIENIFKIDGTKAIPQDDEIRDIIKMLQDAGIIRYNPLSYKYDYSFAFLYKFYLGLKGSPHK